ncbi:MAG: hypothetical protein HYX41_04040 [Bdellovibrio sp.]|nr:hypothetical protein [Bdellovibrio sp.]
MKFTNSAIVGRAVASGGAITSSSNVNTSIYMNAGDSAAVAAINNSDIGTDFNKDDPRPGGFSSGTTDPSSGSGSTVQTDPLFTLLSSKNYRKKKSQVVVFVTPEIIKNPSTATEDLKRNFRVKVR